MSKMLGKGRVNAAYKDSPDVSGREIRWKSSTFGNGKQNVRSYYGGNQRQQHYESNRISGISPEDIEDFRQIFEFYDIDNTKTMDIGDLEVALRALGFNPTAQEIKDVTKLMDVDGDTTFDFSEFCMLIEHIKEERGDYGELREAFRCLDHNGDGLIVAEDLIRMLTTHSDELSLKDINEMIRLANKDTSGLIDYKEFVKSVKNLHTQRKRQNAARKLLHNFVVSTRQSNLLYPSQVPTSPNRSGSKKSSHKKTPSHVEGTSRNVETVDTLIKALGGPILLTSAIIVTASTPRKVRKHKWPSLRKVLALRKRNPFSSKGF